MPLLGMAFLETLRSVVQTREETAEIGGCLKFTFDALISVAYKCHQAPGWRGFSLRNKGVEPFS